MADDIDPEEDPLNNVARGLFAVARAIDRLGTANATTPMGAIEMLSMELKNGFQSMSEAIDRHADRG